MAAEIRLSIGVPTSGRVPMGFAMSLVGLTTSAITGIPSRSDASIGIRLDVVESSVVHSNREKIVARALERNETHLLFLDDDMTFESSALDLMFSRRQPIVVGNYLIKTDDPQFVAVGLDGKRVATEADSRGLEPIAHSGFGFSLFEMDVFRKIQQPWFAPRWSPDELGYTTEDVTFFERARAAGFTVYLDHDASKLFGHVGQRVWRWNKRS